ncbi:MAG: hypothetical protein WCQ95_07350 [Bacteroidota bacterium]
MKKKSLFFIFFVLMALSTASAQTLVQMDSAGWALKKFYVQLHVDSLWTPGHHVKWETGTPDQPQATQDIATHCSAFVAAACLQRNIYILRPPEHDTELLANAQYDWLLGSTAAQYGWVQLLKNPLVQAQCLADSGFVVVAVCKNPDARRSGHIALVMPAVMCVDSLWASGPTLIMAGRTNTDSISTRGGFGKHLKTWPPTASEIRFFYYDKRRKP